MYCPKCAAQNIDDAKYCRTCGADLSLVAQAMSGRLPEAHQIDLVRGRRRKRHLSIQHGIRQACLGVGFLIIAIALASKNDWAIWMLIPAFALLGHGIAEIVSLKYGLSQAGPSKLTAPAAAPKTGELPPEERVGIPPPSVTEETTRLFDGSAERPVDEVSRR